MTDNEKLREKRRAYYNKCKAEAKLAYDALMKFYPLGLEDLPDENWLDVEGSGGMYKISTYSRVKSFKRRYPKILKPNLSGLYMAVTLFFNGKHKICSVHALAARAFIPNPEDKPEVNHIDGNKLNCHISNLEWATQSENIKHAFRIGIKTSIHGADNVLAKLTEDQVREIRRTFIPYSREFGARALARKYNVNVNTIKRVIHGKIYRNVPRDDDNSDS